jgi:heme oxygenase-like protein
LGGNRKQVQSAPRSLPVEAMWGYNYGAAGYGNPCSVFGMLYALETIAQRYALGYATAIARSIGATPDAHGGFKFLSSHARMDADHVAKFRAWVNEEIKNPAAHEAIISSAKVNLFLFQQLFR